MEITPKQFAESMEARGLNTILMCINPRTKKFAASVHIDKANLGFAMFMLAQRLGDPALAKEMATACLAAEAKLRTDAGSSQVDRMFDKLILD